MQLDRVNVEVDKVDMNKVEEMQGYVDKAKVDVVATEAVEEVMVHLKMGLESHI